MVRYIIRLASQNWEWNTLSRSIFGSTIRPTYPDDKNPLDEGEAEATDGPVASCDGIGQAEGQAEPDPVEQEGHWRDRHWAGHSYFLLHVKRYICEVFYFENSFFLSWTHWKRPTWRFHHSQPEADRRHWSRLWEGIRRPAVGTSDGDTEHVWLRMSTHEYTFLTSLARSFEGIASLMMPSSWNTFVLSSRLFTSECKEMCIFNI